MNRRGDAATRGRGETPESQSPHRVAVSSHPLAASPRRRFRRPIRFTRFGTFYILFSLAVGAAAINTSNNLLYLMLGLLLGFIIISGFLSDSCLWGLEATFVARGDFYVGQPAQWDVVVKKTWFPGIIAAVEGYWGPHPPSGHPLPTGEGKAAIHSPLLSGEGGATKVAPGEVTRTLFYYIPRYGTAQQPVSITPQHRGHLQLDRLRYSTAFPFGLFEKSRERFSDQSAIVFPQIKTLPLSLLRAAGAVLSDQPAERKGPGATPFDLREFQMGDSSKRIHWKSSAKRGRMMVVDMEEESGASHHVQVTRWPADAEDFISFVASLVYTLLNQGQRVAFRTPGADFPPDRSKLQLKKILTYLALLDPAKEKVLPAMPRHRQWIDALAAWERYVH